MKFKVKLTGEIIDIEEEWHVNVVGFGRTILLKELVPYVEKQPEVSEQNKLSLKEIIGGSKIKIEIE
ncbi:MAG: hypothetical protein ACXVB1_08955 [Pseudobdellovibrionaceae bacterium]